MARKAMKQKAGWLTLAAAAERCGLNYETFRSLAKAGLFTTTQFTKATVRPQRFVREKEVDAFREGGLDGLRRFQSAKRKQPTGTRP
jgi:hypothetical protein